MKIIVLGAGAWGTALAVSAVVQRPGAHTVTLWGVTPPRCKRRSPFGKIGATCQVFHSRLGLHLEQRFPYPELLSPLTRADLVVVCHAHGRLAGDAARSEPCVAPVAWLCKGFEAPVAGHAGLLGHEIQAAVAPEHVGCGILSGPSFAAGGGAGQPTALVAASQHEILRKALVDAFHGSSLRIYANDDVVGVEVGGAVKNVLAIATGLCDGLQLGLNARAALITRGLAEMTRLGLALGCQTRNFYGLEWFGRFGLNGDRRLIPQPPGGIGHGARKHPGASGACLGARRRGVYSARTVLERAHSLGVAMPITESVVQLLDGRMRAKKL